MSSYEDTDKCNHEFKWKHIIKAQDVDGSRKRGFKRFVGKLEPYT